MSAECRFKEAFERARHDSEARHRDFIDPVTLLVGMIDVEDAMFEPSAPRHRRRP
jgi:hypothetical protein